MELTRCVLDFIFHCCCFWIASCLLSCAFVLVHLYSPWDRGAGNLVTGRISPQQSWFLPFLSLYITKESGLFLPWSASILFFFFVLSLMNVLWRQESLTELAVNQIFVHRRKLWARLHVFSIYLLNCNIDTKFAFCWTEFKHSHFLLPKQKCIKNLYFSRHETWTGGLSDSTVSIIL